MPAGFRITLLLLSTLLLTSCYPGTELHVVNHAGEKLTVISMDTQLKETPYSVESGQTVRIDVPYKLRVQRGDDIWKYDLPPTPLPKDFCKRVRGNWRVEKFQIESDGTINVLFPDSQGPVINPPV